jgi:hypothetical protein
MGAELELRGQPGQGAILAQRCAGGPRKSVKDRLVKIRNQPETNHKLSRKFQIPT